ncbi:MAG: hypothetical protein JWQ45_1895 [Blastococcus sp.]|jgi:hypothetical protein|nr:hypothetical protein [Blastococcus sp.]
MRVSSAAVVCRTVFVMAYLLALVTAGRPGWGAATAAPALVAVWLVPLAVAHARHRSEQPALTPALPQPGEVRAG